MTDLEARLDHALKADVPAVCDPMFRIAILVRRERAAVRRRLLAGAAVALAAAVLAALAFGVLGAALPGDQRLAALAAAGVVLTALLAAPYLGGTAALRVLAARAASALRAAPGLRLWP